MKMMQDPILSTGDETTAGFTRILGYPSGFVHPYTKAAATQAPPNDAPTLSTRSPSSESPVKTLPGNIRPKTLSHPLSEYRRQGGCEYGLPRVVPAGQEGRPHHVVHGCHAGGREGRRRPAGSSDKRPRGQPRPLGERRRPPQIHPPSHVTESSCSPALPHPPRLGRMTTRPGRRCGRRCRRP